MNVLESKCKELLESIINGDINKYNRLREYIVVEISDNDYSVSNFEDSLSVGKALVIILDDLDNSGIVYKRIVLLTLFSLLTIITNDKYNKQPQTAIAAALLLILFSENQNFIGGVYFVSKLQTSKAAAHQYIGMCCVFYWTLKFNDSKPNLLHRTENRLQNAINTLTLDIPESSTRMKVIDFEHDNFKSMIDDIPLDMDLIYPGLPYDYVSEKVPTLLISNSLYFEKPTHSLEKVVTDDNNVTNNPQMQEDSNNSESAPTGCSGMFLLSLIVMIILTCSI